MLRLKRYIAVALAMMLVINIIQVNISAETVEMISAEENATEVTETPSAEQSTDNNTVVVEETHENVTEPQVVNNSEVDQTNEQETSTNEETAIQVYSEEAVQTVSEGVSTPDAGSNFANSFKTVLSTNDFSEGLVTVSGGTVTLTVGEGQGKILELLSNQTQTSDSNYQNWNINFSSTGTISLSADFSGLGSDEFPFKGKFTGQSLTISTPTTLFKALHASADLHGNKIEWKISDNDVTPTIPILTNVLVADGEECTINMPMASANRFNPYIGELTGGTGKVTLPTLDYSGVGTSPAVEFPGNVGLVCNSMNSNTNLQVGVVKLPDSVSLNFKSSQNVGGLVGNMGGDAKLTITESLTLNAALNGTNAGGLVGSMTNATIDCGEGELVTVNATLTATQSAGGIAGVATTTDGLLGANANVVLQSVKANGTQNSGVLYGTCTATRVFNPLTGVTFGTTREVSGGGNCGGLFGTLTLQEDGKCTISGAEDQKPEINSSLTSAANTTAYGGVAGTLTGARANAMVVKNCAITSNINVGTDTAKYPKYLGGIVAKQATVDQAAATLDAKNSTITVKSPKTATATDYGFGGVTAYQDDNALLIADGMKVITDSYSANPGGGGVVGSAHKGSIVYLKTSLDLSECQLSTSATSGQIVGSQDCSLVYAPDVAISRLDAMVGGKNVKGMELDDIGNYGELYRIPDFLTVDENTYLVRFPSITGTNNKYTLSSSQEYACLALAWHSRGYFPTVAGVTKDNWSTLKSSTITLGASIDLTGCGIGGLTRDVYSVDDTFNGTINGGSKTLTLDIGAKNVANGITTGDGRIYWHSATGLFAAIDNNAIVKNLKLDGSIRLSNNKLTSAMSCGALAAQITTSADASKSMLTAVSTEVNYDAICSGSNYILYLGGLFGQISAKNKTIIDFTKGTNISPTITITYNKNCTGSYNHFGGAIGAISGNGLVEITCNGATIGDAISNAGILNEGSNNPYNMYVGGLVGTIMSGNKPRSIKILNLTVNGIDITGSASQRMGGILGAIWADTDVTIDGLTITGTSLTASGAAELGGLVYRASGKWTVSSLDLSGLTINASTAQALGLLVCHGEPYKESVNATTLNTNVDGLYLEMTEYWAWDKDSKKGYKVPSISSFGTGVFDEFVAYTAYRDSNGNYDITKNGSGIISLKTDNGYVNMTEGDRNTYFNRTIVGQSNQINPHSRYYYNLDSIMSCLSDENDNIVDSAEELLIWSVCRYADSTLREHFKTKGIADLSQVTTIGSSSDDNATFDMDGLSYYPINITNESITVQNADVKFYNSDIEEKETGNKSTRDNSTDNSQHYTMHCALFLNFTAENIKETKDYTMTVNGVSFAGTVGVVNGGSGTLLCGNVKGESTSGNTANCTVILAYAGDGAKPVSLNGLSVSPEGDYAPVLINKIGSYAGIKANYITVTNQQKPGAGSSLIGDVGSENATNVTVIFGGTIILPETSGVFTKATLLNSLRYADGSATYTFVSDKDNGEHNTTHGFELSESVEYFGKCGFYDDDTNNTKRVPFPPDQSDFKRYLPYVANSPATNGTEYPLSEKWHELAVNIHSEPLTDGCGTYGHPYKVTAMELREAANYINTGVAFTGWQISVPNDKAYHTEDTSDILLTYKNGGWKKADDSDYTKDVRKHLQSAYYQLVYATDENGNPENTITLNDFLGIGTKPEWAFKGVITGKIDDNNKVSVTLAGGSSAFIKYSYGSVVRDVDIHMEQSLSLTHLYPTTTNNITAAQQAPSTFFGGVIGCVLGGDNIIENVTVSNDTSFGVTSAGANSYLVPVGGYVGVIAGGGVIFRGTYSDNTGITGTDSQLYRNPIIGRVLGGYAFYEGTETAPNNGNSKQNQDYKINQLNTSATSSLTWDDANKTLTVNNAQGLLILSAIVSSGAGSTESNAYKNGVARNASYNDIGSETVPGDYSLAQKDATAVWNNRNTPYLLSKYASYTGNSSVCTGADNGISILFSTNSTFNMNSYGNGYRGLSARYVSNAAFKDNIVTPSAVVMRVKSFDGQNANVQNINMNVEEYADDDFHMASMGGIFNIVWTQKQSGGGGVGSNFAQNLTLTNCNVSLKYVNSSGVDTFYASTNNASQVTGEVFDDIEGRSGVSVGGFIGCVSDTIGTSVIDVNSKASDYRFSNIHIVGTNKETRCSIIGPNSVGGLIGATAMTYGAVKGYPGILLSNGQNVQFAPSLLNCSYKWINVTAQLSAGGMIGHVNARTDIPTFGSLGESATNNEDPGWYTSFTVTQEGLTVGEESSIKAEAWGSVAGGIYAATGMRNLFNAPDVDGKTGLSIKDENQIYTLQLKSVNVSAYTENRVVKTVTNGANANNGNSEIAAGGITARHGSQNPSWYYNISLANCNVSTYKRTDNEYAGGIVGSGYTNQKLVMEQCEVNGSTIESKNAGGFLGYGYSYYTDSIYFNYHLSNSKIEGSTITGTTCAGGLAALSQGKYYFSNILIKNTSVIGETAGRLLGKVNFKDANAKTGFELYAAGISVYTNNSQKSLPNQDLNQPSYIGYIAYADYAGTETEVQGKQEPYVTVNPNYTLLGTGNETGQNKMLTGDAVGKVTDDTYLSVVSRIWADHQTGATGKKNLASYAKVSEIVNTDGKNTPEVSTFKEVQGYSNEQWTSPDLPVLVLKGNDASAIEDYLNVITNGGYGVAKSGGSITMDENSVSVYYYNKDNKSFSKATTQLSTNPASIYYENGQFHIRSRSFDNTLDRFSLVEAEFTVTVNGVPRTYTVSLPVVVIRELQYDYMATFSYGKEFKADTYDGITTHLLESTGNPFSLYLTYQYNRENGQYVEYDWQTYMDDGGSMLAVDKVLHFSSGLPAGTQMIMVDCQNGNQAYQFTTIADNTNNVQFSDFISLVDGTTKFQSSMADVLGVRRSEAHKDYGKYVTTDKTDGTVRLNGIYYRPYNADTDAGMYRYDLTVPNLSSKTPEENYYLVITVPNQSDPNYYINGFLKSRLNWSMPSSGTKLHRHDSTKDNSDNTESTYQISTGYRQTLESNSESLKIDLNNSQNKMQVKLQDTITFSNQQTYGDSDQLFIKFTANLKEHTSSNSEEKQFPVGTSGIVKFYVQDLASNFYYTWNGTKWVSQTWSMSESTEKPVAASYPWESNGGNMELLLSADGNNALDLAAVRQAIKGTKNTGDSNIIVTAEMDVEFGTPVVLEATVPGSSENGNDIWAQLHYVSQIATQKTALSYSSMRAAKDDNAGYYRNVTYQAVLSMDAANIDQLGVNPLQLVEDYQRTIVGENGDGKNASLINLNAVLDLSNLQDIESLLNSTESITFTLSLQRRSGDEYVNVDDASNYIQFDKGWTWEISKDQNETFEKNDNFDGNQFSFPIEAYVFTDQVDFANYKISLGVTFNTTNPPHVESSDANVIYTYACIKPTFYTFPSNN